MKQVKLLVFALLLSPAFIASQQSAAPAPQTSSPGATRVTLDDAIRLALQHNHALQALRSTIQQSLAEEITANLRPNPTLGMDAQFLPIFQPDKLNSDYLDQSAQFDAGIGYLFERGKKRQHRLQAAKDQTAVVRSLDSHVCPICSATGTAVQTPSLIVEMAPAINRLEVSGVVVFVPPVVPRSIAPRAPPAV